MTSRALAAALVAVLVCSCATSRRSRQQASSVSTIVRLVPVVPQRLGFAEGDEITIEEIVGSAPRLEVGGVYLLTGRYSLRSRSSARLTIFSTGSGNALRTQGYKNVVITKGEARFHLAFAVLADGDLHLSLHEADDEYGNGPSLGTVYFRSPDRPFLYEHE